MRSRFSLGRRRLAGIHLSFDGILQPLGYSQIARPMMGLTARGIPYTIVSLERAADVADAARVSRVRERLANAGVDWTFAKFTEGGGGKQFATNVASVSRLAFAAHMRRPISLVHARGFPVALSAVALSRAAFAPMLYDTRAFWVEQRVQTGLGKSAKALRMLDHWVYERADGLVSLTQLGIDLLREGKFGRWEKSKPALCIPTCVDYAEFSRTPDVRGVVPPELERKLRDGLVVGWIGSVNPDYLLDESMRLFAKVHAQRPDALLLCLSPSHDALKKAASAAGVPESALVLARAQHDEMAAWLPLIDWGLLLLREDPAKAGSMPTKLGEFFAAGVRPIHFGCNAEVGSWVKRAGSGISLDTLSDASLDAAAQTIAASTRDEALLAVARERTQKHFDLAAGVRRYEMLIRALHEGAPFDSDAHRPR